MQIIKQEKFNKKISEPFDYEFEIKEPGLYIIEISARAKSSKQIRSNETDDDDLRIEIDGRKFSKLENKERYFDSPSSFSGGKLHNLRKTIYFLIYFSKGKHFIKFIPDKNPFLEEMLIKLIGDKISDINLDINQQAEDGDRRPWITFVLVNLPLKFLYAEATTKWRLKDSDDLKLIIDNQIQENKFSLFHKNWLWAGSIFKKLFQNETQSKTIEATLQLGLHYIEFWADKMPVLHKMSLDFGLPTKRIPDVYDPEWTENFDDDSEQIILARAIFGEARNIRLFDKARIAVAWSIRNRVEDTRWGNNYHKVITREKQYSAFNAGDPNRPYVEDPFRDENLIDRESWKKCYKIAGQVIRGEVEDPTNGANHYFDESINTPYWANEKTFKIKINTIFFHRL